jgi:hypothetical protein
VRVTAEDNLYPCRVTVDHAAMGESLLLLNYVHLDDPASPYRSQGPIFVREAVTDTFNEANVVPRPLRERLLSLRGYDAHNMMIEAEVVNGTQFEAEVARQFANVNVAFIHAHYARRGCYACRVERA